MTVVYLVSPVALVKAWIVSPGLCASRNRRGRLIEAKKRRMPVIAVNGLLVLVPCAF